MRGAGAVFDTLIIGGGCNGTGLARDLAKRGLRVVLCEKGDFARGATGGSSGMIHGGPRYLLYDAATTRLSCLDSGYIQKIAPFLLFRIPFLYPIERKQFFGRWAPLLTDVFFQVYDRYTPLKNGIPHARLTPSELLSIEPGLQGDFIGGVTLDEWGIDPGRLCVLNVLDAAAHGAEIRAYCEVDELLRDAQGQLCGARVREQGQSATEDIMARTVVNCAGPWAAGVAKLGGGGVELRPGKGVHLIYEKRLTNFAVVLSAIDGRQVFVMPYQNETWVGTTDDDYYGDLDRVDATQDEVDYLQQAAVRLLPELASQRLIGVRTGVRNTLAQWGHPADDLSRRHEIVDHADKGMAGFYSVAGGKLASYRIQAEHAADAVCQFLDHRVACRTHIDGLPGSDDIPEGEALARHYGVSSLAAQRLINRHGGNAVKVLEVGGESATGYDVVCPSEPTLECEIRYCIRNEWVHHLSDLMMRCRLAVGPCMGMRSGLRAAQIFAEERGLDVTDERHELLQLLTRRWAQSRAVMTGAQLQQAETLMTQYTGLWQLPQLVPYA